MKSLTVKKGDKVLVIAGKDSGKTAKVLAVSPEQNRVVVENVNVVSRHTKARNTQQKSQIVKREAAIDASNVLVVCPKCGKATRVGHKIVDGKKVRVCKKCGEVLDSKYVKPKKEAKKAEKVEEKPAVAQEVEAEKPAKKAPAKKATTAKKTTKKETKGE